MKLIKLFFVFIYSTVSIAQEYSHYTEEEGLVNNSVNCISLTQEDHIWVGTNNGISFFDGSNWESFTVDNSPEMLSNSITAIYVASDGAIWVGTDFGLNVYDGENWISYTENDGLGDDRVSYINEDENGIIWVTEKEGLSKFDGNTWTSYGFQDGLPFGGLSHVTFDSNNELWLSSSLFGLIHFDGVGFTTYNTNSGIVSNTVRSVAIDENDTKWVGTAQGISVLSAENQIVEHHTMMLILPEPDTLNPVVDIKLDSQGNIWTGVYVDYLVTVGGVAAWNGASWTGFTDENDVLVGPVVRALAINSNDEVWVATSTGLTKMTNPQLSVEECYSINSLSIFPNPASATVRIQSESIIQSYRIVNLLGQTVLLKDKVEANNSLISVEKFPLGLYIVEVQYRDGYAKEFIAVD